MQYKDVDFLQVNHQIALYYRLFMGNITRDLPKDGIGALKIGTTGTGGGGGGGGSTGIGNTGTGTGSGIGLDCFP